MADTRRYAMFIEIFVVFSDTIGFVSDSGFDFCAGICLMLGNNFG